MKIIVAADENWAIGKGGELLIKIPADHKRLRSMTLGEVVVLGRKTLETFPQKMPLESRTNIILSQNPAFKVKDAIISGSVEELLTKLKDYEDREIFVLGGDSIYKQLLPYCDTAYVTKLDYKYDADTYFPNLDEDEEWEIVEISEEQYYNDITYHFVEYRRI